MVNTAVQSQGFLFDLTPVNYQEYLLVIQPDPVVGNDILYSQKKAAELSESPLKNCSQHIIISSFYANSHEEDTIANLLQRNIKGKIRTAFIWLDNYTCHTSSGSIFIRSKPVQYFNSIQQIIYPVLTLSSAIEKSRKVNFVREPHIPILKTNKKKIADVWDYFKDRKYENKFIADSLLLIKRNTMEDKADVVMEIKL